jgi:hypothetical protein
MVISDSAHLRVWFLGNWSPWIICCELGIHSDNHDIKEELLCAYIWSSFWKGKKVNLVTFLLYVKFINPHHDALFHVWKNVRSLRLIFYVCSSHSCFQVRKNLFMRVAHLCDLLLALLKVLSHLSLAGIPHGSMISSELQCFQIFTGAGIVNPSCIWDDLAKMTCFLFIMTFYCYVDLPHYWFLSYHMTETLKSHIPESSRDNYH